MTAPATCSGDHGDCPREVYARGLCRAHYRRWRRGLSLDTPIRSGPGRPRTRETCSRCPEPHLANGLCRKCYDADRR